LANATVTETFESRELFDKADALIKRNRYSQASALLVEALRISPENPRYLSFLGLCVGMKGDLAAAEKTCRKAAALSADDPIVFVNLGRVLLEGSKRKEARKNFMLAYKLDNTNAPAALELSRMGVRRKPVLPFLDRNNMLNVYLGKLRHRIIEAKNTCKNN